MKKKQTKNQPTSRPSVKNMKTAKRPSVKASAKSSASTSKKTRAKSQNLTKKNQKNRTKNKESIGGAIGKITADIGKATNRKKYERPNDVKASKEARINPQEKPQSKRGHGIRSSVNKKTSENYDDATGKKGHDLSSGLTSDLSSGSKNEEKISAARPSAKDIGTPYVARKARDASQKRKEKKRIANSTPTKILSAMLKRKDESDFNLKGSKLATISSRTWKTILIVFIAVVFVVVGIFVGIFAFMTSTSAELAVSDDAKDALSKQQENKPYYMLMAADINEAKEGEDPNQDYDVMFLTKVDPTEKKAIIIDIPTETYVTSAKGGATTFKEISKQEGDGALITAVSSFSELGISQFVKMSADGIKSLVDSVGGIDVNIKEEIDDPKAGNTYIPAGESHINGTDTLILLRASDFNGGATTISLNKRAVAKGMAKSVFSYKPSDIAIKLDDIKGNVKVSMSTKECLDMVERFQGLDDSNMLDAGLSGYYTKRDGKRVFMSSSTDWKALRSKVSMNEVPTSTNTATIDTINPGSFTIHVRNGAGINGGASMVADQLKSMGYNVVSTDNAEQFVYGETLIVYNNAAQKSNAEAVMNSLENGRLVEGTGMYNLTTDVMVILGSDYKV